MPMPFARRRWRPPFLLGLFVLADCTTPMARPDAPADAPATDAPRLDAPIDAAMSDDVLPLDAPGLDAPSVTAAACVPAPRCPVCSAGESCGGGGVLHECGARACTHYVSSTASGTTFASCTSASAPCTLATANAGARAGDVVCLAAGEYRGTPVAPASDGTADRPIVFRAADFSAHPVVRGIASMAGTVNAGIRLIGVSHVEVDAIDVRGEGTGGTNAVVRFFHLDDADDCWIRNGVFFDAWAYAGAEIQTTSARARITTCTFENAPGPAVTSDTDLETRPADTLVLREPDGALVEDNTFGDASHAPITVRGGNGHAIIRRNVLRNRLHAGILNAAYDGRTGRLLIEDNRILDTGSEHTRNPNLTSRTDSHPMDDGMARGRQVATQLAGNGILMRRNDIVRGGRGVWMTAYGFEGMPFRARRIRIAHNTIHGNVTGFAAANDNVGGVPAIDDVFVADNLFTEPTLRHVTAESISDGDIDFVANGWSAEAGFRLIGRATGDRPLATIDATFASWQQNVVVEPTYVSSGTDDYRLGPGSGAIDAAIELAHVTATEPSGGGTLLSVDDTLWFFDGFGIPGQVGDVLMTATGQVLHVVAIDSTASTILVEESVTIAAGEGLGYAYTGEASDLGAHEVCP